MIEDIFPAGIDGTAVTLLNALAIHRVLFATTRVVGGLLLFGFVSAQKKCVGGLKKKAPSLPIKALSHLVVVKATAAWLRAIIEKVADRNMESSIYT